MQERINYAIILPIEQQEICKKLKDRVITLSSQFAEKGIELNPIQHLHVTLIELQNNLTPQEIQQIELILSKFPPPPMLFSLGDNKKYGKRHVSFIVAELEVDEGRHYLQQYQENLLHQLRHFVSRGFLETLDNYGYNPHISFAEPDAYDSEVMGAWLKQSNQGKGTHFPLKRVELNKRISVKNGYQNTAISYMGNWLTPAERLSTHSKCRQLWSSYTSRDMTTSKNVDSEIKYQAAAALMVAAEDYLAPKSASCCFFGWSSRLQRIVTGHWNRHHLDWARGMVQKYGRSEDLLAQDKFCAQDLQNLYQDLLKHKANILTNDATNKKNNPENSSSLRRINFAITQLEKNETIAAFLKPSTDIVQNQSLRTI